MYSQPDTENEPLAVTDQQITDTLKLKPLQGVSHKYCFMTGRHGEFFYLKFGAACKHVTNIFFFTMLIGIHLFKF